MLTDMGSTNPHPANADLLEVNGEAAAQTDSLDLVTAVSVTEVAAGDKVARDHPSGGAGPVDGMTVDPVQANAAPASRARSERTAGAEKVRGMNASLTTASGTVGGLREREPGRLHVTRRQIAFAVVLAVLAVVAAVLTFNSVSAGSAQYQGTVTTSQVYNLNFGAA
ncbi:MAG TPA: hypothetical protein VKI19_00230, partial [Acidimicrobiales bacterium]|nr:hypothetical protein [Acidimicrobiales bacterium]